VTKDKIDDSKVQRVPVTASPDELQEVSRLMDTFADMTNPWVLSTVRTPMFPYWRDVRVRTPKVDLADYGDKYVLTAELPGFEKEDIDITVNGFSVEIKAERDLEEKGKTKNYVQRERLHSSFQRVVQFPQEVTPSRAKALLKNGLLEVEVPKLEPSDERSRKITIK
jgi:HSP20 family protein